MTDNLQRQSGDPSASSDATSPDRTDPSDLGATYSNAEKWKMKANKDLEQFLSSCPGYHGDTSASSEKSDHRYVCWLKLFQLVVYKVLSRQ